MYDEGFKVGDIVLITKSKNNWNSVMNKFVDHVFEIQHVIYKKDFIRNEYKFKKTKEFPDINDFQWVYKHNHFIKYTINEKGI